MTPKQPNLVESDAKSGKLEMIHALEFECQAPLKFFEQCSSCSRFSNGCADLAMGKEILSGKKRLVYSKDSGEEGIHSSAFGCLTPVHYFEKTRKSCAHRGRCREEGLLFALLNGKRKLTYAQKAAIELPRFKGKESVLEIPAVHSKVSS